MTTKEFLRCLRMQQLSDLTGLSPSTIKRMIKQGEFPAPFKPHPNSRINLWLEETIDQWMEERASESR